MTGTNCDLFTHNQSRSYLNHLVVCKVNFLGVCTTVCSMETVLFLVSPCTRP
jgi:hypothetical protein